jgi:hypothetical protein
MIALHPIVSLDRYMATSQETKPGYYVPCLRHRLSTGQPDHEKARRMTLIERTLFLNHRCMSQTRERGDNRD